jgi:hypothetical protein
MNRSAAHKREYTRNQADLYVAFELGQKEWKLGFTVGFGQKPRERAVLAGDLAGVKREIDRAKRRFGLSRQARVLSCYEAGEHRGEPEGEAGQDGQDGLGEVAYDADAV